MGIADKGKWFCSLNTYEQSSAVEYSKHTTSALKISGDLSLVFTLTGV